MIHLAMWPWRIHVSSWMLSTIMTDMRARVVKACVDKTRWSGMLDNIGTLPLVINEKKWNILLSLGYPAPIIHVKTNLRVLWYILLLRFNSFTISVKVELEPLPPLTHQTKPSQLPCLFPFNLMSMHPKLKRQIVDLLLSKSAERNDQRYSYKELHEVHQLHNSTDGSL